MVVVVVVTFSSEEVVVLVILLGGLVTVVVVWSLYCPLFEVQVNKLKKRGILTIVQIKEKPLSR